MNSLNVSFRMLHNLANCSYDTIYLFERFSLSDVTRKEGEPRKRLRRTRVKRGCGWWARCGSCLNYVDVFGGDVVDTEEKNNL